MNKPRQKDRAVQNAFSKTLCRIRKQRNLSQENLAHLTDMHRTAISALERGKREPGLQTLVKLSDALEMPINDFFVGIEWRPLVLAPVSAGMGCFHVKQPEV